MKYTEFRNRYHWSAKTDKLGEGGFGKVYRAMDTLRSRLVVLKIADVPLDHKFSLQREVDLNRDLVAHPNIVQYRNCYRFEDQYGEEKDYATMDYFKEGSLATVLNNYTLLEQDQHDIILGILQGLAHLDHERVIHRDFKPGNVLMTRSENGNWLPKIADFGLSRFESSSISVTNSSVGISYDYAAPEQFRAGTVNKQVDLWAAGVIFYQLLTKELPFATSPGLSGESQRIEIIRLIQRAQPPEKINQLKEPYQTIIRRCLVKEVENRAKSADELLALLIQNGPQAQEKKEPPTVLVAKEEPSHTLPPVVEDQPKEVVWAEEEQPKESYRGVYIAVLVVVVAGIGVFLRSNSKSGANASRSDPSTVVSTQSMPYNWELEAGVDTMSVDTAVLEAESYSKVNMSDLVGGIRSEEIKSEKKRPKEEQVFTVVEQSPEFPGGTAALHEFLTKNIKYPPSASRANLSGRVFVSFVVNTDGRIQDVEVLKGLGFGTDEEAIRVIKAMPQWRPGRQSGRPVRVKCNLPINFQLD